MPRRTRSTAADVKAGPLRPAGGAPALDHGLDLLELLAAADGPRTQRQIGEASGKAPSTVFRILNALERRGYVRRLVDVAAGTGAGGGESSAGAYVATLKLYGLAAQQPAHRRLSDLAAQPMRVLAHATGESCHVVVLDGVRVRVVCNQPSPAPLGLNVRAGGSFPAVETSAGRLLLGQMAPERRSQLLAADPVWEGLTGAQQGALKKEFDQAARRPRLVRPSTVTPGVLDVETLLPGVWRGENAVLALPCLRKWTVREQHAVLAPALDAAVYEIVAACGAGFPDADAPRGAGRA